MSVHSILSSESPATYNTAEYEPDHPADTVAPLPSSRKPAKKTTFARKRTYSTPYPFDPSSDESRSNTPKPSAPSRTTTEIPRNDLPPSAPRSRIPKPTSRAVSASQATRKTSPLIPSKPSLLEEELGPLPNGTSSYTSSQEDLDETIVVSNVGMSAAPSDSRLRSRYPPAEPTEFEHWYRGEGRDGGGRNGGRGEISAGTHEMLKIAMGGHSLSQGRHRPESVVLDDSFRGRRWQESGEWSDVRNEEPLTDMEVDGEATDAETVPPTPIDDPRPPPAVSHPSSSILRPSTPPNRHQAAPSMGSTTPKAPTRTTPHQKKPPTVANTPTRSRIRKKTSMPSIPATGSRSAYDLSSVSAFADAVPQWDNQPSLPASGNWDEVVLPTVAKKMRMATGDSTELKVLGTSNRRDSKRDSQLVPPAPGTFDYDESKAHRRNRQAEMQQFEFGVVRPEPEPEPEPEIPEKRTSIALPVSRPPIQDSTDLPPSLPPSSLPPSNPRKERQELRRTKPAITVTTPSVEWQDAKMEDDEHDAGCCKCVIM